jgi:hypothetical protein
MITTFRQPGFPGFSIGTRAPLETDALPVIY